MASERFSLVYNVPSKCIVLHVKLTDSSLKCLENYRNDYFKKNSLGQIKIKLESNQGIIQVPTTENNSRNFSFNLSSLPHNDATTECFLQSDKKKCFQNVGIIKQKIIVRASEDVYQSTLEKISHSNLVKCSKEIMLKGGSPNTSNSVNNKLFKLMESKKNRPLNDVIKKPPLSSSSSLSNIPERRSASRQPYICTRSPVKHEPPEKSAKVSEEAVEVQTVSEVKQDSSQAKPSISSGKISTQQEYLLAREEFERKYKVLSALNVSIENRLKYFNSLVKKFKETRQKELLQPIHNEHAFLSNNDDYSREKEKFNSLHATLSALKKNIQDFKPHSI